MDDAMYPPAQPTDDDGARPPDYFVGGGGPSAAPDAPAASFGGMAAGPPPHQPQGFVGAPHMAAQSGAIAGLPDPSTTVEGFIYTAISGEWSQLRPNQVVAFDNAVSQMKANGALCWSGHDGAGMGYAVRFDVANQRHEIQLGDGHFHPVLDRR